MKKNKPDIFKKIKIYLYRKFYPLLKKPDAKKYIKLFWFKNTQNFGDSFNPMLIQTLSEKPVKWVKFYNPELHYIATGSILETATSDTIVWGSGFISEDRHCYEKPYKVCAVRGPKSREILINDGIECPEIYGDPALLLPRIYAPKVNKSFKLGIIPHFVDKKHEWLTQFEENTEVKIIDIQNPDLFSFIDDVLSCEKIASSSLHGVIVADAYNIPSLWIEFSDKVSGEGFKFLDYFLSVKRKDSASLLIDEDTKIEDIYKHFYDYKIDIDLNKLLDAAPFKVNKKYFSPTEKV